MHERWLPGGRSRVGRRCRAVPVVSPGFACSSASEDVVHGVGGRVVGGVVGAVGTAVFRILGPAAAAGISPSSRGAVELDLPPSGAVISPGSMRLPMTAHATARSKRRGRPTGRSR